MRRLFSARTTTATLSLLLSIACGGDDTPPDASASHDASLPLDATADHDATIPSDGSTDDAGMDDGAAGDAAVDPWERMETPTNARLVGVWGFAADDVYAVGAGGVVLHFDGEAWTVQPTPTTVDLEAVWGIGDEVWAVGETVVMRRREGAWTVELEGDFGDDWRSVSGLSATDVLVLGGSYARYLDGVWIRGSTPFPSAGFTVEADPGAGVYWGGGANHLGDALYQGLPQPDGTIAWIYQNVAFGVLPGAIVDIARSDTNVFALSWTTTMRWNGESWVGAGVGIGGRSMWVSPDESRFFAARGMWVYERRDGTTSYETFPDDHFMAVWSEGTQVYFVGDRGVIMRKPL